MIDDRRQTIDDAHQAVEDYGDNNEKNDNKNDNYSDDVDSTEDSNDDKDYVQIIWTLVSDLFRKWFLVI